MQITVEKCRNIWITRCEKSRFELVMAKIWIKKFKYLNIFTKKNVGNYSLNLCEPLNKLSLCRFATPLLTALKNCSNP